MMEMQMNMEKDNSIRSWLLYVYRDFWSEYGTPIVADYPLMSGPWQLLCLVGLYLYFVKVAGPRFMSTREAFDLKWPMRAFNSFNVMLNLWGFREMLRESNFGLDIWRCPKQGSTVMNPYHIWLGSIFLWSRIAEFADTIFFVLRKKNRQISNLHVFHHSVVPIAFWSVYKFVPTIENGIYPFINAFVHVIMYLYYTLASFGPKLEPYLWWKKHLTALQLIQFIVIIVHALRTAFIPGCSVGSSYFIALSFLLGGVFFYMFFSFYRENYVKRHNNNVDPQRYSVNENAICECLYNGGCKCETNDSVKNNKYHSIRRASFEDIKRYQNMIYRNVS